MKITSDFGKSVLRNAIKVLLFFVAFTPLIVVSPIILPFMFGKVVFFRILVEAALILFLIYFFCDYPQAGRDFWRRLRKYIRNPLFIFVGLLILSYGVSAVFAVNSYRAFWGTMERGEGVFGMLHFFVLFFIGLLIFEKKDWLQFLKLFLLSGAILIFYGFLQYFKVQNFPFVLPLDVRITSFFGNAAFLAVHSIFLMVFAVIVFFNSSPKKNSSRQFSLFSNGFSFWQFFSLLIITSSILAIFLTGTRGVILGLGAGFLFLLCFTLFKQSGARRYWAVGALIFLIVFVAIFWTTRQKSFWQKIPGFDRLAKTAFLDVNDASTQTRLITWRLSLRAFSEKPFLGWGPENYLVAYEKHYDPTFAVYGETWLDRAHNKIFDVLVMQGIFGLLVYFGLFGAIFWLLFKKRTTEMVFAAAGVIAYFVQNLVLFDQLNSYITFFVLLGFLVFRDFIQENDLENESGKEILDLSFSGVKPAKLALAACGLAMILGIVSFGYVIYTFNIVPFVQARNFYDSPGLGDVNLVVERLQKAMFPYNFAQYNIRSLGIDTFYLDQYFYNSKYAGKPEFVLLGKTLLEGMDELVRREPYDIRLQIRETEMLNGIAKFISDEEAQPLFQKAEALMREAAERAPRRQEVYYHLALNLAGQRRFEEALQTARYALSLNFQVARARINLALMLALTGRNEEAIKELAAAPDLRGATGGDLGNILLVIYGSSDLTDKMADLVIKTLDGRIPCKVKKEYYERTLGYYAEREDAANFLLIADYLSKFTELKDDMEVLIDLAQKGRWEIIHKL